MRVMKIQLNPNEKRGWWKRVVPDRWAYRAKAQAKVNERPAMILWDSGAEVSLISSSFAHELGVVVDPAHAIACEGVGGVRYETEGVCTVKVTLANELAYELTLLVGPMEGQDVILGLDFMARAGVRLDAADGSVCLPDDVYVRFEGRKQLFNSHARPIYPDTTKILQPGRCCDVKAGRSQGQELWVRRGKSWITTVIKARNGDPRFVRVTNICEDPMTLGTLDQVGVWMAKGFVPRKPGFVRDGSRRSVEWGNLAYSATTDDDGSDGSEEITGPMVEKSSYITPTAILKRDREGAERGVATNDPGTSAAPAIRILQVRSLEELDLALGDAADEVVIYEREDPNVEDMEGGFAIIPEVTSRSVLKKEDLKVGDPTASSSEDLDRLRDIIWSRKQILMGKGDAMPPAAKGVICDIDVGNAAPIAQQVRKVRPEYLEKLFELIKGLLKNGLIVPSKSPWASPIVIVLKKNGDIRLCIDYRMVNVLTRLMVYPMPLVSDLLENLDKMMWYCSLDMASGFWVVSMTARARLISAFITPFGLFEWTRMPFGLKNAPQIYQRIVDNVVYNTFLISNEGGSVEYDVFESGIPTDPAESSLMKRRSYIDDFLIPSKSWDALCETVTKFLDACVYWNLSISVDKSEWGMPMVEYLGHKVDRAGIQANPKNPEAFANLTFPTTLRAMQSFLGSVNYYSRFVNDYATIAAILYEWKPGSISVDEGENQRAQVKAEYAFELLKQRIVTTPRLLHFDPERQPVVAVYATRWSISGALLQQGDDGYEPIRFTSRVLKKHERNYSDAEKEVLALLRVLDVCFNMLAGRRIRVLTSHSTLGWLWKVKGLQGRLAVWAAMLSGWTLEIQRSADAVQSFLGLVAAGSAPLEHMNEALEEVSPLSAKNKGRIPSPIPVLPARTNVVVASFDGSARSKRQGGSCSAILWKFPEWTVIRAASRYFEDITVNEAEYQGIRLAFELASDAGVEELVICGDSKLVIKQLRQEMECKAAGLQLLWREASQDLGRMKWCELVHVKREWNGAADLLATRALQAQVGMQNVEEDLVRDMETLNRLNEVILIEGGPSPIDPDPDRKPQVAAVVTRGQTLRQTPGPEEVTGLRIERLRIAQSEEAWIREMKAFLDGNLAELDHRVIQRIAKIADSFEIDEDGVLRYLSRGRRQHDGSVTVTVRLVIPTTLVDDVLHHFHSSVEGGHQGVGRTYAKAKRSCYWRSMYRDVQGYVASCVDCQTGKGRPGIRGTSPGNVEATYPFQIIAMDHVPSMPRSHRGNTELLLWVDLFSGYVIAKANDSRQAPVVAEAYEECVFRRFGASEYIRHDREPGFMADFFEAFNKLMGQRQRATMAYRPQANGSAERMVQTLTRAIRMYVEDEGQRDWDDYAERLVFALNTSHDRIRDETPFYLVHGWDPKTTLESTLRCGSEEERGRDPRQWRFRIQRQFMYARRHAEQLLREAQADRVEQSAQRATTNPVAVGCRVWLYIERVREGLARKLAHKWHGPFRVLEVKDNVMYKLDVTGSGYRVSPWVHLSRLKLFKDAPFRPTVTLNVDPDSRFDFEEALLPEDSYAPDPESGVFEVEELLDREVVRPRTRNGRSYVKYLVKWKGYDETSWVEERDLNCGGLIYDFNQRMRGLQRFQMMQVAEDPPGSNVDVEPRD